MAPRVVSTPTTRPPCTRMRGHFGLLVNLALRGGRRRGHSPRPPHHGARSPRARGTSAPRMGACPPQLMSIMGMPRLDEGGVDGLGTHAVMLVDLGAPAHGAHGRIGVRQGVMAARRIEQIQIEVFGQVLPKAHALVVELDALGGQIIRADDRGIAAGIAAADIAFFDHGDIADAVIASQIVGRRQAVAAAADDHHIVAGLQRVVPREHPRFRMLARKAETK